MLTTERKCEILGAIYLEAERKRLKKMARKNPEALMDQFRMLVDAAKAETRAAMLEYIRSASVASNVKATTKRDRRPA